ncbi:hypothetical protein [Secundilactobacillus pentosiphilus]|nr:hypothetical protein [Secundilactobacillus pentosiphilus]
MKKFDAFLKKLANIDEKQKAEIFKKYREEVALEKQKYPKAIFPGDTFVKFNHYKDITIKEPIEDLGERKISCVNA